MASQWESGSTSTGDPTRGNAAHVPANKGSFGWVWATRSSFVAQTILRMARRTLDLRHRDFQPPAEQELALAGNP